MITIEYTGANDYGEYVNAFIVGPVGKGKTRFSATAKNVLLLDARAGSASIADKGLPRQKIKTSADLLSIIKLLSLGPEKTKELLGINVDTVSLDTLDEVCRILIRERLASTRQESLDGGDWSWLADQLNAIVSALTDLDMHVMIFSHIKRDADRDSGDAWFKPDISGGAANQILQDMDMNLLIDEKEVPVVEDDKRVMRRKAFLISAPFQMFEYLKDRSNQLPDRMELNFEDDFQRVIELHAKGRTQDTGEVREVDFDAVPQPTSSVPAVKKSVQEQTAAADKFIAEAEAKVEPQRRTLTEAGDPSSELATADLTAYSNGDRMILEGDIPKGYYLDAGKRIKQERNIRFVYEVNGEKMISRNQLEKDVLPIPNPAIDSGVFCQVTGIELLPEDANISRIRARKVLCEAEFEKAIDRKKTR